MKKEIFRIKKIQREKVKNTNKLKNKKGKLIIFKSIKNNKKSKWSKEEDETLLELSQRMRRNKWKFCSIILKNKSSYQCYLRYKKINPNITKGRWTDNEDIQLIKLVNIFGKSWKSIAKIMKTRTNKQIRNRYEEHLSESLNKGIFSNDDDENLISLYYTLEEKWYKYKEYFPDRSIKRIKSRIQFLINRQKRIIKNKKNIVDNQCKDKENITSDASLKETLLTQESSNNFEIIQKNYDFAKEQKFIQCFIYNGRKTIKNSNISDEFHSARNTITNNSTSKENQGKIDYFERLKSLENIISTNFDDIFHCFQVEKSFSNFSINEKETKKIFGIFKQNKSSE